MNPGDYIENTTGMDHDFEPIGMRRRVIGSSGAARRSLAKSRRAERTTRQRSGRELGLSDCHIYRNGRPTGNKLGYATKKRALTALAHQIRKEPNLNVYRCVECRQWHIGHIPAWKRHLPVRHGNAGQPDITSPGPAGS